MKKNKIRRLPAQTVKDVKVKNLARRLAGLSPLRIKVVSCLSCGQMFETVANRTCGCNRDKFDIGG